MSCITKAGRKSLGIGAAIFILVIPLFLKDLSLGELNLNNDETRHAMTGVYFRDLLCDLPLSDPLGYTYRYYARYPALGLIHWPPLFYLLEGLFFLAFGLSITTAKVLVVLFALLLVGYWYKLAKALFGTEAAFFASLLLASTPAVVLYSRAVMLEIPSLALSVATLYHFHRCFEEKKGGPLPMTFFFIAACLTKATVVFLVPLCMLYLLSQRKLGELFTRRMAVPALVAFVALGPYYAFALQQHGAMLSMDLAQGSVAGEGWGLRDTLSYYLRCLPLQLGWPLLVFTLLSGAWLLLSASRRKQWILLLWILTCYLVFTPIAQKAPRYIIYWVPPLTLLAAQMAAIRRAGWMRFAGPFVLVALFAYNYYQGIVFVRPYVEGYREAARFAVERSPARPIFFQGFLNGNFIFHVRQGDPDRRSMVIRGGKVLVATIVLKEYGVRELAHCEEDIHNTLQRYGVEYVIVEDRDLVDLPIYGMLREMLQGPDFLEEARFPLKTNMDHFQGISLAAYRYLRARPLEKGTRLVLPMPVLGRDLEIDLEKL